MAKKQEILHPIFSTIFSVKGYLLLILIGVTFTQHFFPYHTQSNKNISFPSTLKSCETLNVIDGDSLIVRCPPIKENLHLRLSDIDAPEQQQSPWGEHAKQKLQVLTQYQKLTIHLNGIDIYQRYLATVYNLNYHLSINEILLKEGMVTSYRRYHPPDSYLSLKAFAKKHKLGIWSKEGLQQNPKKFRQLFND